MKKTVLLCLFLSSFVYSQAQYLEIGGFAGVSMYSGDLQFQLLETKESNLAFGAFARYNFTHRLSAKLHYYKGTISGKDQNSDRHISRNLDFQSDIREIGLQGEFNVIPEDWDMYDRLAVYVFTGVSGFMFNPQSVYNDEWVDLQPLATEGQTDKYSLQQIAIPLGFGLKFAASDFTNVGFEMGMRKTFTDYLDDVSTQYPDIVALGEKNPTAAALSYRGDLDPSKVQGRKRGNPDKKDWYFFTGVTFSINLIGYSTTGNNEYNGIF